MKIIKRIICLKISCLLVVQQSLIAGGLTVDKTAPTSNQANLESAKNGVPIVNIVAPNQKGLSHNKFSDYNVNKEGLILNNSNKSATNTQLAGYIYGNQNLKNGTAKTILNEVTSKNKSELKGFTEVAGDRANVVVANPNGIYINGAGFINTSRATITTGNPNIKNGEIDSFDVRQGQIDIDGEGLNLSNVNKAELYAQTVKLNAKIHSQDLDVVTGQNSISKDGTITNIENSSDEKPTLSIDSSALGGIYANKISLVGTQKGVGVNLPIEISAQDDFKLSADGKIVLDKVISEKNIDIKSDSSDINSKTIYGNNVNIEAKNSIKNEDVIASKTNIDLKANNIENENLIASGVDEDLKDGQNGKLTINTKNLENKKILYAKDNIDIKAINIENKSGNIQASNIDIKANNFEAKSSNIVATNENLNIETDSFILEDSYLNIKNNLSLNSKNSLNLKDNTIVGNNLNISADEIYFYGTSQNKNILYSTNDILINTKKLISNYLFTQANNNINIDSSNIDLKNSKFQSVVFIDSIYQNGYKQGDINLTTSNLNLYNTTLASKDINIKKGTNQKLQTLAVENSSLDVNNNIDVSTTTLNAKKSLFSALNDLLLTTDKSIVFLNNNFSANNLSLSIDENLTLDKSNSFLANNNFSLNTKSLVNNAQIISNGNLTINTNDFIVNNALLSSKNILNLNATNYILNNDSNESLFGTRGAVTNLNTKLLTNYGFITSLYDMNIKVDDLINYAGIASANSENKTSNMNVEANNLTNYNTIYSNDNINLYVKNSLKNITDNKVVNLGNEKAIVFATNNIFIQGDKDKSLRTDEIINDKSIIQTQIGNINIFGNKLENLSQKPTIKGELVQGNSPYIKGGTRVDTKTIARDKSGYTYNSFKIYTDVMTYESYDIAKIISGKDIYIDVKEILNQYSLISTTNNMLLNSDNLINNSIDISQVVTTHKNIYEKDRYCKRKAFGKCLSRGTRSKFRGTQIFYEVSVIDQINSIIEAGGTISGNINKLENGITENKTIELLTYNPKVNTNLKTANIQTNKKTTENKNIEEKNNELNKIVLNPIDENYILPTNKYSTFTTVNPNKNLDYLVESNPLYTNHSNFIGSSYFLEKMNFQGDKTMKRLGDAAYETKLVSDAIFKQTGQRFLSQNYTSENAQFVALMENAVNLSSVLGLELGKPLTASQLVNLTEDIVWMEEKVVNGQTVLVPVVYLAKDYNKSEGAVISAKNIDLEIKDNLVNSGTIKTNDYLNLNANSITNNSGVMLSGGKATLISNDDFINKNGGLIKGSDIQISSLNGNVINETYFSTNNLTQKKKNFIYTNVGKTSSIEATNGNLIIQANKDITNMGADLVAKDNVLLQTQNGDINLNAIELKVGHNIKYSGGFTKALDREYKTSNIDANNIIMQSGKDINLEASKLNADNQINLNAKNDVNIEALNNLHYTDSKSTSKGFLSKTTKRDMVYKESVNSAELNANDILINANNDVNLQAAKLKAQDNIIVNAKDGNLNIVAKEYREGELHEKSKSSWGGLKKSLDISSTDALKLNSALLKTEASNVVLTSGKDINILASEINSGADIQLKALNDVLIASQSEYLKTQEVHKKSSFNLAGLASLVVPVDTTIYSSEIHKNDKLSSSSVASKLNANKDILIDSGSTTIAGSNLEANNIGIKADTGEINILSSQDVQNVTSLDKEIKLGLSDPIKGIVQNTKDMLTGETKIKFEVGSLTYDEVDKASQTTKNNSSNLKAKENLVLDSLTDINVQGSNLKAGENLVLNSTVGDINILNTTDIYNEDIKEKHAKASVNVTVQNEYVEIGTAVKSAVESAEQLKQTKDDYSKYKGEVKKLESTLSDLKQRYKAKEVGIDYSDIEDLSDFIDELKSQEKYYVAAIAAATADLASKTAAVATQAAAAASSSGTWGFSAGISLDVNGEKSKQNINNQTSNASNLNGKNIYINTDEKLSTNTNVVGSNVIADENLYINTNNLNVKASQDNYTSKNDSESINGSIAFTMYGGGGGTAGLGYGKSDSSSDSFLNNNSQLSGNNVNINVKNDAVFQGANVRANDTLNLNVGNNLVLESLRDEYSSNSKGFNVNAGIGFGSAGAKANRTPSLDVGKQSSTNAGFSVNNGVTQNKQTVLSSITGDKVNVNVGNNTHLKGSLLASGNYDENGIFQDNKNLNFITNTLTFGNLSNSNYSSSKSLGVNVNYNLENKKVENGQEKPQQKGISSVGYQAENSLSANASKTLATLGTGNVTVKDVESSDELDRLNRDTTAVNKDLYSSSTGTKVDATLDTRLLTEEGRKQIAEDIERTKRLGQAIGDVASSDSLNISDTFDHIGDVQKDLDVQKALALNDKGQTINILENQQNYSQEQIDKALNDYAQIYASVYGINIENAKIAVLNGKYGSTYTNKDNTNSNIYLDKGNNQNALDTANTLGHEVAHVRQNQGQTYLRDTLQLQEEYANLFGNYSSSGLDFSSYVYNNVKLDSNKINSLNSINDLYALYQNSVAYKKDVAKVNSGDGKIDDSIFVEKIEDNKYKVIDGKVDGKKEVYDEKGNVIAKTITQYSGFNEENKPVIGAIIDFSDKSGKEFLNTLTDSWTNPVLYFQDARNGGTNDFKTNGTVKGDENYGSGVYHNRFMIIDGTIFVNNNSLTPTIATGRDIGNIGAGYVAGSNFLSWSSIRIGFDGYNFIKNGQLTESPVSKEAQIKGFILGNPVYRNIINLSNELKND
ncbi:hemagglutinin repeat-containing protein [Aliarcobacter butzleri]|uniref:two-partner secretion domain-containing protein n=1 Tax=Aliarcobacter butzleri TaxID=28197 RepID=UPI001D194659|nr:hemagglutinin repeat-containing protein [Aliarcobacter butzleri]